MLSKAWSSIDLAVANEDSDDVTILLNDLPAPPVVPAIDPQVTTPAPKKCRKGQKLKKGKCVKKKRKKK